MTTIDHSRSSELLVALVEGRLGPADARAVEAHLATCARCRAERAAVEALMAARAEPLSQKERERLHTAVGAAAGEIQVARRPRAERWRRRLAPALGAAAMLVVVAVGVFYVLGNDTVGPRSGLPEVSGGGEDREAPAAEPARPPTVTDEVREQDSEGKDAVTGASTEESVKEATTLGGAARSGAAFGGVGTLAPHVAAGGSFAEASLDPTLLGPASPASRDLAGRASELPYFNADSLARRLAPAMPSATVRACIRTVLDTQPYPLVPVYAAAFPRDAILVIGFVWVQEPDDRLMYAFWGWRNDDCDSISPIYRSGVISSAPPRK